MQMTESEIKVSYQQAKSKKEQLKILAELNACTVEEIIKILVKNGISPQSFSFWARLQKKKKVSCGKTEKRTATQEESDGIDTALQAIRDYIDSLNQHKQEVDAELMQVQEKLQAFMEVLNHDGR